MSGSGGFYKYRCKYFYSHNCPNWVWVNNAPCTSCIADGRDEEAVPPAVAAAASQAWRRRQDIFVPRVMDGSLHYTVMELFWSGSDWAVREKAAAAALPKQQQQQQRQPLTLPVTSAGGPSMMVPARSATPHHAAIPAPTGYGGPRPGF